MTAGEAVAVFIVVLLFIAIIFIGIAVASSPNNKEQRYQAYKNKMDKKEDLEKELLEFAERYKREKEGGE